MTLFSTLRGAVAVAVIAMIAGIAVPALAQDDTGRTTTDDVRAEIAQAMETIASYSAQERDQALAKARETLARLDTEIERREQALRDRWADMSGPARESARARLQDLKEARNTLDERYDALRSGTTSAWGELKAGFANAWFAFSRAWKASDKDQSAK